MQGNTIITINRLFVVFLVILIIETVGIDIYSHLTHEEINCEEYLYKNEIYFPDLDEKIFALKYCTRETEFWYYQSSIMISAILKDTCRYNPGTDYLLNGMEPVYYKTVHDTLFLYICSTGTSILPKRPQYPVIPKSFDSDVKVVIKQLNHTKMNEVISDFKDGGVMLLF